jgi:hypothetical protein
MKWLHKVNPDAFRWPLLLTLTLPAGPDGKALVSLILQAFKVWRRTLGVKRYLYAIELKPHAAGYYVHLHALIDCVWLNLDQARGLWHSLTGASVIDARRVNGTAGRRAAVREVVKYCTKAPDRLTVDQVDALGRIARGRRLVAARGCCLSRLDTKETSEQGRSDSEASSSLLQQGLARIVGIPVDRPTMPCPKCAIQLQFVGFVPAPRPEDTFTVPDYDFTRLDAVRSRAGPSPGCGKQP